MKGRIAAGALASALALFTPLPMPDADPDAPPALSQYQRKCADALAFFITQIPRVIEPVGSYSVSFGETWRPEYVARMNAARGIGIVKSLHVQRLAVDLNLFIDGKYQADGEAHKPLAELWLTIGKSLGVEPAAGYYFNDGNHYSCAYGGRK